VPDLRGDGDRIVSGGDTKRGKRPSQAVRPEVADRLDSFLDELRVRLLDRTKEESPPEFWRLSFSFSVGKTRSVGS
jgi:hypothetical protein